MRYFAIPSSAIIYPESEYMFIAISLLYIYKSQACWLYATHTLSRLYIAALLPVVLTKAKLCDTLLRVYVCVGFFFFVSRTKQVRLIGSIQKSPSLLVIQYPIKQVQIAEGRNPLLNEKDGKEEYITVYTIHKIKIKRERERRLLYIHIRKPRRFFAAICF